MNSTAARTAPGKRARKKWRKPGKGVRDQSKRPIRQEEHREGNEGSDSEHEDSMFRFYSGADWLGSVLETVPNMNHLTTLILVGQPLDSLSGIETLLQITELWAVECRLTDVAEVLGCTKLVKLYLYSNYIKYFPVLDELKKLETLWLSRNCIERIYNVRQMPGLKELYIADNMIREIGNSFENSSNLETLNMAGNPIKSLHEVANLRCVPSLRTVMFHDPMFSSCPITGLCHYRPYTVYCLPQITSLDFFSIEEQEAEFTKTIMLNQLRYYSMAYQRACTLHYKGLMDWAQNSRLKLLSLRSRIYESVMNRPKEAGVAEQKHFESEIFQWENEFDGYNPTNCDGELQVSLKCLKLEMKFLGNLRFENHGQDSKLWELTGNMLQEFVCQFANKYLGVVRAEVDLVTHVISLIDDPLEELSVMKGFAKYEDLQRSFMVVHTPICVQHPSIWPSLYLDARFSLKEDKVGTVCVTNCLAMADSKWLTLHEIHKKMASANNTDAERVAIIVYLSPSSKLKKEDLKDVYTSHTGADGDGCCSLYTVENTMTATPKFIVRYHYVYQESWNETLRPPVIEEPSSPREQTPVKNRDKGITVLQELNYSQWSSVSEISITKCRITTFGSVGIYPQVKSLDVSFNLLDGLREVSIVFPGLVSLKAAYNEISSIGPISVMNQLETLNVQWNRVDSLLSGLKWLKKSALKLKCLDLRYNGITDVVRKLDFRYFAALELPSLRRINDEWLNCSNPSGTYTLESIHDLQTVVELAPNLRDTYLFNSDWFGVRCSPGPHVAVDHERNVVCLHLTHPEVDGPQQRVGAQVSPTTNASAGRRAGAGEGLTYPTPANIFHNFKSDLPLEKTRWLTISKNQLHSVQVLLDAPNLEELDLSSNTLQGIKPGGSPLNLINLVKLNISDNYLTSMDDFREANLPSLQVLNVSKNLIISLEGVQNLEGLVELYAAANRITKVDNMAPIKPWKSLKIIDVSHNRINETPLFRKFISFHMPKIEYINGVAVKDYEQADNYSGLGGSLDMDYLYKLHRLPYLYNLTELTLTKAAIRKINLDASTLQNLRSLNLEGNCLTSMSGLGQLKMLTRLCLSHNMISHFGDSAGHHQQTFPNLQVLHLNANNVTSLDSLELRRLPKLTVLFLQDNQISNLYGLRRVKTLEHLVLDRNRITLIQPHDVCELENLSELYLESNLISDLDFLSAVGHIKRLFLAYNRITEASQLGNFRLMHKLGELSLTNNPVCRTPATRWRVRKQIVSLMPKIKVIDGLTVDISIHQQQETNRTPRGDQETKKS